ncbi:hypothetical protein GCM10010245_39390 [Streptomyces spectabilis]|nr:hypothetical protein GCM10010245_39390 [Streptomyces spectabilis]
MDGVLVEGHGAVVRHGVPPWGQGGREGRVARARTGIDGTSDAAREPYTCQHLARTARMAGARGTDGACVRDGVPPRTAALVRCDACAARRRTLNALSIRPDGDLATAVRVGRT